MKEFNLGSEVVVSDPFYKLPTWCQAVITGVLPGKYIGEITETDGSDGWGIRIATLSATHEDYVDRLGFIDWEESKATIGVDSGQCGIFDKQYFRDDKRSDTYGLPSIWGGRKDGDGDLWYERMCSLTLGTEYGGVSDDDWGVTPDGVVSSSGYGDGAYTLMLGITDDGEVVGFEIVYIGADEDDPDDEDEIDRLTEDLN